MSFKKFGDQDVFLNTMKAYPQVYFTIYDGDIYYNGIPNQSGTMTMYKTGAVADIRSNLKMDTTASSGFLSLYEYNIDRPEVFTNRTVGPFEVKDRGIIYPFITKDSARSSFRTAAGFQATDATTYQNEFAYAEVITGSYPLKASITRRYIATPSSSAGTYDNRYVALRNRLNFYKGRSMHYAVKSSTWPTSGWNKNLQALNLVSVPSIFYGTKIKPGTVSLRFYYSGSLIGELQDTRQNGELVQTGPYGSPNSGSIAGVALYDEGLFLLTGSWALNGESVVFRPGASATNPKWIDFAAGAQDGANVRTTTGNSFSSASFDISFKGHTETQVMTMFAHAKRGQVNYSNNPTFLTYGQSRVAYSSSAVYEEASDILIKNTVSSSHVGYNAPFKRQVYVSRIGIYDDKKNLIGIATLANPVLKEDDRDYAFKIKLDI
tara:strand:- start:514 stop:1818 length:1305 start_codon:yes stop_codon:yes gene_type:complete